MLNKKFYKREEFLKNNDIPMRKEIRASLKNQLTDVYFSQLDSESKKLVGLEPPLTGPGEELMVFPMDELNENTVLKSVSTKEIQALTHTAILTHGDKELGEIEKDKQMRIETAVLETNEIWWHFTKAHTKGCVKEAVRKERDIQNKDILALVGTFNHIYKSGLDEAQKKFNKQTDVLIIELRDAMKKVSCCEQDQLKMEEIAAKMKVECENRLIEELEKKRDHFDEVLMLEQARFAFEMNEKTRVLRHNLECRGIVDILYMACMEKHYYHLQHAELEKKHYKEVECLLKIQDDLEKELTEKRSTVKIITAENKKLKENLKILCREYKRLFSCHTNLPFEQLGFLPQFENIFINNVFINEECQSIRLKETSIKSVTEEKVQSEHSKDSKYFEDSQANVESTPQESIKSTPDESTPQESIKSTPIVSIAQESIKSTAHESTPQESTKSTPDESTPQESIKSTPIVSIAQESIKSTLEMSRTNNQQTLPVPYFVADTKKNSQVSDALKSISIVKSILENSKYSMRTSILKDPEDLLEINVEDPDNEKEPTQDKERETSLQSLHRDSVTLLKEKCDSLKGPNTEFSKVCPEPECQFNSVIDYDFPPHVAHLALINYDHVQTFDYGNYERYTVDELQLLTDLFFNITNKRDSQTSQTSNMKEPSTKRSSTATASFDANSKLSETGSNVKRKLRVNMNQFGDAALKNKTKVWSSSDYRTTDCPVEVTKEIIEQIFTEHPSLTKCILDL